MEMTKREMTKLALEALRGGYIEKAYGLIEDTLTEEILPEESHRCSTCQCVYTDDEGGIEGDFGILPMSFCPTCLSSICDMADQLNRSEWESLTDEEILEIYLLHGDGVGVNNNYEKALEKKLREKNYYDY